MMATVRCRKCPKVCVINIANLYEATERCDVGWVHGERWGLSRGLSEGDDDLTVPAESREK
jgi:hypothetical protein